MRATASKGNVKLSDRYSEAWDRIECALDRERGKRQEFYFEAIAIEESILSNRISSFLHGIGRLDDKEAGDEGHVPFANLINRWRKAAKAGLVLRDFAGLVDRTDDWRKRRNRAVHSIAKSFPGQPPKVGLDEFLAEAKRTAQDGKALARDVEKWHKRQLRKDKKPRTLTATGGI